MKKSPASRAKPSKRPEELLDNPAFLATDVARLYRTTFDARMKGLGLGRAEWWLLSFLCYFEGSTQQTLAEVMDITKGGMGKLIDRLERDDLVQRSADGIDRRSKRVFLTELSRPLAAQVDAHSEQVVADSLASLSAAEIATLKRLLLKLRAGFGVASPSASRVGRGRPKAD